MKELIEGARRLGLQLTVAQVRQFDLYYRELVEWNTRINLTAITDYRAVQVRHFLDSLTVIGVLPADESEEPGFSLIDIGAGAGFPGVPLKIALPQCRLVLLESTGKKAAFLRHIVGELDLVDVEVLNSRAEETAHLELYRERFSLVVSRALGPLPALAELTLPFCRIGGRFVAHKKGDIEQEIEAARSAIRTLGGRLDRIETVELGEAGDVRYLVLVDKISATPDRYPRRAGLPKRRPIREVRGNADPR